MRNRIAGLSLAVAALAPFFAPSLEAAPKQKPKSNPRVVVQRWERKVEVRARVLEKAQKQKQALQKRYKQLVGKQTSKDKKAELKAKLEKKTKSVQRAKKQVNQAKKVVKRWKKKIPGRRGAKKPKPEPLPEEVEEELEPFAEEEGGYEEGPAEEEGAPAEGEEAASEGEPAGESGEAAESAVEGVVERETARTGNADVLVELLAAMARYLEANPAASRAIARALLEILGFASSEDGRARALDSLDLSRAPQGLAQVASLLANDGSATVRSAAAGALGSVAAKNRGASVDWLVRAFGRESEPEVRADVVRNIVRADPVGAADTLKGLEEEDASVRTLIEAYLAVLATGEVDVDRIESAVEERLAQ